MGGHSADMAAEDNTKIPVTILTGYLGSGKTTFVNYLLKENHGHKFAIIENEFGEVGIDDGLVLQSNEEVIEMMNGCICCTVREDLIETIKKLVKERRGKFDHIIIETTGLADPAPVAQTFFIDPECTKLCRLDAIVTFIDAKFTGQHLDEEKPEGVENEAHEQVAFADVMVLNKTDLVTPEELEALKNKLNSIKQIHCPIIEAQYSRVPVEQVINVKAFDLDTTLAMDEGFLDTDAEHQHDSSITSFGVHIEGEFIPDRLNAWLSRLMQEKGPDLYRSKGILAVMGSDEKYVFQAVHMIMNMGSSSELGMNHAPWGPDEKKINKFCFIGKNLDKDGIIADLEKCVFDGKAPDPGPVPTTPLTYAIGDRVKCNCGDWMAGEVVKLWYRESLWETGRYAPYQVQLDDGGLIYVPRDTEVFVRPADQ